MNQYLKQKFLNCIPSFFYPYLLKRWYKLKTGKTLNLKHPKSFNEKIQWLKLYDSTPLKTRLADKYLVREWIKDKIGDEYLIPLLGVWNKFDDIDFDKLPNQFVLKANHGCAMNIIVKDKTKFDKKDAKQKFDNWLKINFAFKFGYQMHYKDIIPKIIAEQIINIKFEYKIFCSKDNILFVLLEFDNNTKRAYYDENFKQLNFSIGNQEVIQIEKPKNFDEMLKIAKLLSTDFYNVRVDFYSLEDGSLKFSEMTFTSCSGLSIWSDDNVNLELGKLIHLPTDQD